MSSKNTNKKDKDENVYDNKDYWACIFTLNNYTIDDISFLRKIEHEYMVFGFEVGEKGTPHIQGYIEFLKKIKGKKLKEFCNKRISWKNRTGSAKYASLYCKKGEQTHEEWDLHHEKGANFGKNAKFEEWGKMRQQGKRTDLTKTINKIATGEITNVNELALTNPVLFHTYGRTLQTARNEIVRTQTRRKLGIETKGFWIYGKTDIGKSHEADRICGGLKNEENVYDLATEDKGWWEGYLGQKYVVLNDFRGELPYSYLLKLVDKWNHKVIARNTGAKPFISEYVIITSSLPPWLIYKKREKEDSLEQLLRRFTILTKNNREEEWKEIKEIPMNNNFLDLDGEPYMNDY